MKTEFLNKTCYIGNFYCKICPVVHLNYAASQTQQNWVHDIYARPFRCRNIYARRHLCAETFMCGDIYAWRHLRMETFWRREGKLQQIFVFFHLISTDITNWKSINAFIAKNTCCKYVQMIIDEKRN